MAEQIQLTYEEWKKRYFKDPGEYSNLSAKLGINLEEMLEGLKKQLYGDYLMGRLDPPEGKTE